MATISKLPSANDTTVGLARFRACVVACLSRGLSRTVGMGDNKGNNIVLFKVSRKHCMRCRSSKDPTQVICECPMKPNNRLTVCTRDKQSKKLHAMRECSKEGKLRTRCESFCGLPYPRIPVPSAGESNIIVRISSACITCRINRACSARSSCEALCRQNRLTTEPSK